MKFRRVVVPLLPLLCVISGDVLASKAGAQPFQNGDVKKVGSHVNLTFRNLKRNNYEGTPLKVLYLSAAPQRKGSSRASKPKLGAGVFEGTASLIGREGDRIVDFWVRSGDYTLMLDARSAIIVGGVLSEGGRVRVNYRNLQNSEMDIGRAFSGRAVRVVVIRRR